ncbi:MAG: aminotransferase class III-fold pyridoxal phosphate-dependent enzyme [Clostridia bacterium]|nr:aminotransferase class III-fold pyridoxal phosphate-dependent enzyme [Clostridia bacterium]
MSIRELDQKYVANTYRRFPVEIVSGKGSVLCDTDGREYIDMGSGIAVTSFGAADDEWQRAVIEQIGKVQHTSNLYYTEPCAKLAEALCTRTRMKKVFFSNSGAEANECMIKAARKWAAENKGPDCFTIATLTGSFHGRTITTLAATGQAHYHELFQPLTPGFISVDAGDIAALEEADAKTPLAAVMIECIQGEGGVIPLDPDYAKALSAWTAEHNVLLLVDEVQTGNGRCGALYAYMNYGLCPDAVSTAKGLAGGLPLGATMLGERLESVLGYGDHGSTFGGNPVSCAAALNILSRIGDTLLADVRRKSRMVFEMLDGAPGVEAVSGMGLMIGVKCKKPAGEIVAKCIERGVLFLTAKDKVRLLPALNIPDELLIKAVNVLRETAAE